jgi:hypothetical protein
MHKNRALRRILRPKWGEVTGGKLFHDLYFSPNIIMIMKKDDMGWACGTQRKMRNACEVLVRKYEEF